MHKRRDGLAVGMAATVVGCGLFALGLLDGLVDVGLDLHFRNLSTIPADPGIVLIDIDDSSLEAVGDWPWPRRRHAQLVSTLDELGADRIVLDLVFSDPSPPRIEHAGLGRHYDIDLELPELGDRAGDDYIYDDDELREAILAAGNVYLAVFGALSPSVIDPSVVMDRALALVRQEPRMTLVQFRAAVGASGPWASEQFYQRIRLAAALEDDFGLDESALAERLASDGRATDAEHESLQENLAAAKQLVARRAARSFLSGNPDGTWPEFFERVSPGRAFDALSADREGLLAAFRWADARRSVAQSSAAVPPGLGGRIPHVYDLTLPVDKLARAAKGVGFVAFAREESGGVLRALPLAVEAEGFLLPQLGLRVAMDTLGVGRSGLTWDGTGLVVGEGPGRRRLGLDNRGLSLINWHVPRRANRWQESFAHVSAARLLQIPENRASIADNETRLAIAYGELLKLRHADTIAEYAAYAEKINERRMLRERLAREADGGSRAELTGRLARLDAAIGEIEQEAVLWLRRAWQLWTEATPRDDGERAERDLIHRRYEQLGEGQLARRLDALNAALAGRTEDLLRELGPGIEGKICLVGYTASASAELITSPVYASMPGVMAHANVINMVLQNQPLVPASKPVNMLLLLIGGLAATVTSCAKGWRFSLAALVILTVVIVSAGGLLFLTATIHVASLAAAVLVAAVWAAVTAYRQATEERTRRRLQRALTQYTSPAVAARIAERVGVDDLAPRTAEVTCFFNDLAGFTSLSERLGAERTRLVLNPFLREMSRVLIEHGAIVNKFIGDGVFAFFNAPIHPCENHAVAACRAALAALDALEVLNGRPRVGVEVEHAPLMMRIGVSTGEAFVGDYGSDTKLDYTCIGDTVNVASRLERANKVLGTSVLVDEATRRQAGGRFAFRALGLLELAGKATAVEAYELLGPSDAVTTEARGYLELFERLIRHYQGCEWDPCLAILAGCRRLRPNDRALDCYQRAVELHRSSPPAPDWNRAIAISIK